MNANIIIVRNVFKGDFNSGKHVQYVRKNIITIIINLKTHRVIFNIMSESNKTYKNK